MDQEIAIQVTSDYLLQNSERIQTFSDIFKYTYKTTVHQKTGINYYRLLDFAKNPKLMTYGDTFQIAHLFKVDPEIISRLVMAQLKAKKR